MKILIFYEFFLIVNASKVVKIGNSRKKGKFSYCRKRFSQMDLLLKSQLVINKDSPEATNDKLL